jgi:peptidyl-prolyl cis-trans isomerase A (cyclophilin A)
MKPSLIRWRIDGIWHLPSVMRGIAITLVLLMLMPHVGAAGEGDEAWRGIDVDMSEWDDGPEFEDTPMNQTRPGDAVLMIEVDYKPSHTGARVQGEIIIELFEEWAPLTTANMIMHVESDIYDGIFFHRVIDDFVTQGGDPTCTTVGFYPVTNAECGGGGDGHTLVMEHHENLSHVDGAIGMARSQDPDSADTQWYIAETEAHNLDPENRDDEGYVTFGIVRNGMSHVRAIALTPTSDDPTGEEIIVNPASSAGRPLYEAKIINIDMIGVIPTPESPKDVEEQSFFTTALGITTIGGLGLIMAVVLLKRVRIESDEEQHKDAILLENEDL